MNLIAHLHQNSWFTRCTVNERYYFERIFFLIVVFYSGLKLFSKPCCEQVCCNLGFFFFFFSEHRQCKSSMPLKDSKII